MEILQGNLPRIFRSVLEQSEGFETWCDFVYCENILGKEFARIDNFDPSVLNKRFWNYSPTSMTHLPQDQFEKILDDHLNDTSMNKSFLTRYIGYEFVEFVSSQRHYHDHNDGDKFIHLKLRRVSSDADDDVKTTTATDEYIVIKSRFLVAADGAHSCVRKLLKIDMVGKESMMSILNVHFRCEGLTKLLQSRTPRPAMLYFVFHKNAVCVFILHVPKEDEWVCQIPMVPQFQTSADYWNKGDDFLVSIIKEGIGITINHKEELNPKILSVRTWDMHSQVAEHFDNYHRQPSSSNLSDAIIPNIFLVGDAAHRFPPAGGFGMNSGIQDAQNLAWKLAKSTQEMERRRFCRSNEKRMISALLKSYSLERRSIAKFNVKESLINYHKVSKSSSLLGWDPEHARVVDKIIDALNASSSTASSLFSNVDVVDSCRSQYVQSDKRKFRELVMHKFLKYASFKSSSLSAPNIHFGSGLPLVFPVNDLGLSYMKQDHLSSAANDISGITVKNDASNDNKTETNFEWLEGCRLPHSWLCVKVGNRNAVFSSVHLHWLSSAAFSHCPKYILLVLDCNEILVKKKLFSKSSYSNDGIDQEDNFLVVPYTLREAHESSCCHESLQDLLQTPRYKNSTFSCDRKMYQPEDIDFEFIESAEGMEKFINSLSDESHPLKLMEYSIHISSETLENHGIVLKNNLVISMDNLMQNSSAVLIRPDGYVHRIFTHHLDIDTQSLWKWK